jgi:hypothetical protein
MKRRRVEVEISDLSNRYAKKRKVENTSGFFITINTHVCYEDHQVKEMNEFADLFRKILEDILSDDNIIRDHMLKWNTRVKNRTWKSLDADNWAIERAPNRPHGMHAHGVTIFKHNTKISLAFEKFASYLKILLNAALKNKPHLGGIIGKIYVHGDYVPEFSNPERATRERILRYIYKHRKFDSDFKGKIVYDNVDSDDDLKDVNSDKESKQEEQYSDEDDDDALDLDSSNDEEVIPIPKVKPAVNPIPKRKVEEIVQQKEKEEPLKQPVEQMTQTHGSFTQLKLAEKSNFMM